MRQQALVDERNERNQKQLADLIWKADFKLAVALRDTLERTLGKDNRLHPVEKKSSICVGSPQVAAAVRAGNVGRRPIEK